MGDGDRIDHVGPGADMGDKSPPEIGVTTWNSLKNHRDCTS
jgi:hypothetical protein